MDKLLRIRNQQHTVVSLCLPPPVRCKNSHDDWDNLQNFGALVSAIGFIDNINNSMTGFQRGDVNQDGSINLLDVQPFVDLLASGGYQYEADMNNDTAVNLLDVDSFINELSN